MTSSVRSAINTIIMAQAKTKERAQDVCVCGLSMARPMSQGSWM